MQIEPPTRPDDILDARFLDRMQEEPASLEGKVIQAYEALRSPIHQYLAVTFGDPAEAEDITQETFLRLYRHWSAGKTLTDEHLRSWLFRVAHNLAIDRGRSAKYLFELDPEQYPAIPDAAPNPEEALLDRERFDAVRCGLALLSSQERQCLHLRAEGFRYREIAEILNLSISSVAEFLRRAIHKMSREKDV